MPNNKINRINDDIQYALANLLRQIKDPRVNQGSLMSITRVETTGDLRYSKIYISVLGELNEKDFKRGLKSASPWLRRELGSALKLRYTPELVFELDKSIEHGAHISKMISELEETEAEQDDGE